MERFKVKPDEEGQRLDLWLAKKIDLNRSQVQKAIKTGEVKVQGEVVKTGHLVQIGETVTYHPVRTEISKPATPELKVVYEDQDLAIIDKPAGILTHPPREVTNEATVADFAATISSDPDKIRPGIVHRLDKDTSGLMIIAKTSAAKIYLQKLFKEGRIEKTYLALVKGRPKLDTAEIKLPLARSQVSRTKWKVAPSGRLAVTSYRLLAAYPGYSLLEVRPKTGRTHQLRVHFSYLGHPVAGDTLYGLKKRPLGLSRQFLHASRLRFRPPSGGIVKQESSLPGDLADFIAELGRL